MGTHSLSNREWRSILRALTNYAHCGLGCSSRARAEELVQDAVALLLSQPVTWDPTVERSPRRVLTGLLNGHLVNERRRARRRDERKISDEAIEAIAAPADASPDVLYEEATRRTRVFASLERRFAADAVAARLVALYRDGVEDAPALARAMGASIEEVRNARKRVIRHAEALAREIGDLA